MYIITYVDTNKSHFFLTPLVFECISPIRPKFWCSASRYLDAGSTSARLSLAAHLAHEDGNETVDEGGESYWLGYKREGI